MDQLINKDIKLFENIEKIATGQVDDYTTANTTIFFIIEETILDFSQGIVKVLY